KIILGAQAELGEALVLAHEVRGRVGDGGQDPLDTGAADRRLQVLDGVELDAPLAADRLHAAGLASAGVVVDDEALHEASATLATAFEPGKVDSHGEPVLRRDRRLRSVG